MGKKLDRSKPFGEILGGAAHFVQDGVLFDAHGDEIVSGEEAKAPAKPKAVKSKEAAPAAAPAATDTDVQVDAFLGKDEAL